MTDHTPTQAINAAKSAAAKAAASLIVQDMVLGLGTGSTAARFIEALGDRVATGLHITAVATSDASARLAEKHHIKLLDINKLTEIDLTVDGADEIDPENRMIKGGGGALLREKIVASLSRGMTVIVDETKLSPRVGSVPLPVEILPFAYLATVRHIEEEGFTGAMRQEGNHLFRTDSGHYIYDITSPYNDPKAAHETLINIPGVLETGLFFNLATSVIIGKLSGAVEIRS